MVVLDRDIFTLAQDQDRVDEIASTSVEMTYFDGQIVYEA